MASFLSHHNYLELRLCQSWKVRLPVRIGRSYPVVFLLTIV